MYLITIILKLPSINVSQILNNNDFYKTNINADFSYAHNYCKNYWYTDY